MDPSRSDLVPALLPKLDTTLSNSFSAVGVPLSLLDFDHISISAVDIYDYLPPVATIVAWLIPIIAFVMYFRLARAQKHLELELELDVDNQDMDHRDVVLEQSTWTSI